MSSPDRSSTLRVPMSALAAGSRELDAEAAQYVVRVHRLRPGDRFVAFDPVAATEADAQLVTVDRRRTLCTLSEPRAASNRSRLPVTLLQAIGKGDKLEGVIAAATALGATRIVAVLTERTIAGEGTSDARLRRWSKAAVESARQSGRGDVPAIAGPVPLDAALGMTEAAVRLCLHPGGSLSFSDGLADWSGGSELAILIGPEGGFSAAEIAQAEQAGFHAVTLGRFVLRTELATAAALGAVVARADSHRR
jgi:16S rRNA (uracil1498-N3)-methyltransferase